MDLKPSGFLTNDNQWRYQSFDVTAVAACILAPAIMWIAEMVKLGDLAPPRDSISSYHDVVPASAFYIPLTIAVMLFLVNGWLYPGHRIHVVMSAFLLGVIVFDHDGGTAPAHFTFAVYFFVVGAFLEAARDRRVPDWTPFQWFAMAPILPFWLVSERTEEVRLLWNRAAEIILPFVVLGGASLFIEGPGAAVWLFVAEWISLAILVVHYLADAKRHAHENPLIDQLDHSAHEPGAHEPSAHEPSAHDHAER